MTVLYVFFEGLALYNFARNQKTRQSVLWILGARESVQVKIQAIEYGLLIVSSLGVGCLLGTVGYGISASVPVSYTHLDVYKRQCLSYKNGEIDVN